ncbi:hypothetical protein L1049_026914 [Liquidambar formosana]|uniref:PARP catalytic domain-containing protein n=1 Tax=Liquidambar formosana TaxID=63359 RepID=A0AAP0NHY1_LIQFO
MRSEADDNGEKHLILCRVIVGNVEKVEAGSQQSHPSSVNFDTGVDDLKNPKQYVVWCANMNSHILPECVVGKVAKDVFIKQLRSIAGDEMLLSTIREMRGSNEAGKVAKDILMKQLQLIAGDEMLIPMIRDIHGSD